MISLLLFPLLIIFINPSIEIPKKCDDSVFSICDSSSTHHACKSNKSNKRVEFVNIDEFIMYLCDGEKLIYSPEDNRFDTLQVEYSMIKCNSRSGEWEGIETLETDKNKHDKQHEYKIIAKTRKGVLKCKGEFTLSCDNTRFDFDDNSFDETSEWKDPTYDLASKTYTCPDNLRLYLKKKFTFGVNYGVIIFDRKRSDNGILMAEFAHIKEPQVVDFKDTITCKKFECSDTLDHSLSYLNLLKCDANVKDNCISTNCDSGQYDCNSDVDFFNEQYPCGDKGHEFVVTHKKDNEMKEGWGKEHWVKDNYIDCRDSSLYFTDTQGNQRKLELDDHIQCKLPKSCEPLVSDSNLIYGCQGRYDCYNISSTSIPTHHLAKFDGNCYGGHVLKINPIDRKVNFLIELEMIECRYGYWIGHLLPNSKSNAQLMKEGTLEEGNDLDFTKCDLPVSDCGEEGDVCEKVKEDNNGLQLKCSPGFTLVEFIQYLNGTNEVTPFASQLVCDRGSGTWTEQEFPYRGLWSDGQKKSDSVCAKDNMCDTQKAPKSACDGRVGCLIINTIAKYWSKVVCPPLYEMKLQPKGVSTEPIHVVSYKCIMNEWTVIVSVNKEPRRLDGTDNVYCQEQRIEELDLLEKYVDSEGQAVYKNKESSIDTSLRCHPTKLDSICPEDKYSCEQVNKTIETKWVCGEGKQMLYIEYDRYHKYRFKDHEITPVHSLSCRDKLWRVKSSNNEKIPSPHSNFICVSSQEDFENVFGEKDEKKEEKKVTKKNKKLKKERPFFQWKIPLIESIVMGIGTIILISSICLTIYGKRGGKPPWKR
uniref:Uncharacterized protein n=1 Tax=Pristionchus pacificus TaxID=54126 RepID=A0A8R1ULA6_PRIPA